MSDIAIQVSGVSKKFRIPHERTNTLYGNFRAGFDKSYEEFNALDDVSFEVKRGEMIGIIGRNGSGKSTLLKILAGIYIPDSGTIKIKGKISPFLELGVGFNPELSGRENIYLNGAILGLTKKEIDKKFDEIVSFSEIGRFIDQKLKNYSSGMQVRLAFSVAIHAEHDILLMDEVLAVGDVSFQKKCLEEFQRFRREGKTIILVSHNLFWVESFCQKTIFIQNGKIVFLGDPSLATEFYMKSVASLKEKNNIYDMTRSLNSSLEKGGPQILQVETLNKEGKKQVIFQAGEPFSINISFSPSPMNEIIHTGIQISDLYGSELFSFNSLLDKHLPQKNNNKITLFIPSAPFREGIYFLTVSIFGESLLPKYDTWVNCSQIQFFPSAEDKYSNLFLVSHYWS